jgi:hypothetical protein
MKRDITRFVEQCSTCQQVKAKHQRLVGNAQAVANTEVEVG